MSTHPIIHVYLQDNKLQTVVTSNFLIFYSREEWTGALERANAPKLESLEPQAISVDQILTKCLSICSSSNKVPSSTAHLNYILMTEAHKVLPQIYNELCICICLQTFSDVCQLKRKGSKFFQIREQIKTVVGNNMLPLLDLSV